MPLTDPDEVFYAETAREMLDRDEFLTPYIFGEPQFEKPPLYYWLILISFKALGVNEFSARLPSALLGILGIIGIYLLGKLFVNKKVGFFSALMLLTSAFFLVLARACVIDMLLGVSILYVFLFFFYGKFSSSGKTKYYLLSAVFLALATLAKGPIGIFLPVATIGIYLIATRDLRSLKEIPIFRGIAILFLISAPWYFLMYKAHGKEFIDMFFGFHNITRFIHPEHAWGDTFYYYAPVFLAGFLPWSIFLPVAAWVAFTEKDEKIKKANVFFITWFLVTFLFFSLSRTKLPTYIFPIFPAVALFTGRLWDSYSGEGRQKLHKSIRISLYIFLAALIGGIVAFYVVSRVRYPAIAGSVLFYGGIFLVLITIFVVALSKKHYAVSLAAFMAAFTMLAISLSYKILPEIGRYESSKVVSLKLMELATPEEIIGAETQYRRGVAFYTGREDVPDVHKHHIITTLLSKPERVWCVIKEKNHIQLYSDPKRHYYKPTYVIYQLGKKVILTNNPPAGVPVLKVRTKDEPY